ncbi:heavy metal translocating P-type ATPase [Cetobacterium somerae]|uniref:heavy metal translocating P-type ATPase n=1 Tax=Cetobacterium sp. NK01 TaxID=2993530 RepID=UPI0021161B13|nr:heavy metal translocating P-type ATPase [Cetobacterium sp. NK01]MCQ8212308.1 heavy metal translocating P-type ATPase [Cetobacterium sp. NK01]
MEKRYRIGNVTCQSCVALIEKILTSTQGINNAKVNLATEELFVNFDEKVIKEEDVKNKIVPLGYTLEEIKDLKTVIFSIKGLHCQSCVGTVEKIISGMKGVDSIVVNLATEKATITYDSAIVKLSEVFHLIAKFGYTGERITEEVIDRRAEEKKLELKREFNEFLIAIIFGAIIFYISMGSMIGLPVPNVIHYDTNPLLFAMIQLILSIPVVYVGRDFYISGLKKLKSKTPSMDSLIALGTGAAFIYSLYGTFKIYEGDLHFVHNLYYESGVVIIALISLGKYLENVSKGKTSEAIKKLMSLQSKRANLFRNGKIVTVDIEEVEVGDVLLIKPGESIPTDGVVIDGISSVDEAMLTGESIPVKKIDGSKVYGATINGTGSLKIEVTETGENTTLSRIIRLVENAQGSKAPIARMADVISSYFVPVVIAIAVISSLTWYIVGTLGLVSLNETPSVFALTILISVLVIACPCSLGLATPTAIMVGTGRGAELGILIKSGEALEKTCKVDTVVFDKTGTITMGRPTVTNILSNRLEENVLLKVVGSLEQNSEHPLADAIMREVNLRKLEMFSVRSFNSVTGEGVTGTLEDTPVGDVEVIVGNKKIMDRYNINIEEHLEEGAKLFDEGKTVIYIAAKDTYLGMIAIADKVRESSKVVIEELKNIGIDVIMLTGDNERTARAIAKEVGLTKVIAEVSPEQKYSQIKKLQISGKKVAMVGDGINDSPALTQADIGIAVGGGADIALESADIVLMSKNIKDVPKAIELSRATMKNIKQNLFWAFIYNGLGIPVAAGILYPFTGHLLNPMIAGAAMAMSSVSVVSNALRLKWFK